MIFNTSVKVRYFSIVVKPILRSIRISQNEIAQKFVGWHTDNAVAVRKIGAQG